MNNEKYMQVNELNDKDYLNNLLTYLKEMVKNYSIVLTETSNQMLYKKYKKIFDDYSKIQRETFELLYNKGWYQIEEVPECKINIKYQTLLNELNNLKK